MGEISLVWVFILIALTWGVYAISSRFLKERHKRLPFLALLATVCLYSGVGIAYESVDKINTLYYGVFIVVLAIAYCCFVSIRFKSLAAEGTPRLVDDEWLWSAKLSKQIFVGIMVLYLALRCISLVYPVNHLANFKLVYDSSNNINSLTGKNSSFITTAATIIYPFFFVGMYYSAKKVRHVAIFMSIDSLITLITTGYLSRHEIITIVLVCALLYVNGDIGEKKSVDRKKVSRIVVLCVVLVPVLAYIMVELMNVRTAGGPTHTVWSMLESEIGYPKQYELIHSISPIVRVRDFFLQLLDSFVPIIPTPGGNMDLNVTFSEHVLGVDLMSSGFYIKLPSLLGEAFLIFGKSGYWVHAVVIAFLTSVIYKMVGTNKHLSILWYYYVIGILKVGRAGYIELSQGAWLNYVIFFTVLIFVRMLVGVRGKAYVNKN